MFKKVITLYDFIRAACKGKLATVRQYVEEHKDDKAALNGSVSDGDTALICAAQFGNTNVVYYLLSVSAIDTSVANQCGNTALMMAVEHDRDEIVADMLEYNADVNVTNLDGYTPLMKAAMNGNPVITKALLAVHDINLFARNRHSHSAADEALLRGHSEIAQLIKAAEKIAPAHHQLVTTARNFFICPFTGAPMKDPIALSTGAMCDREGLRTYFTVYGNPPTLECPVTGGKISITEINTATNLPFKQLIDDYLKTVNSDPDDFLGQLSNALRIW
ncbi:MAG: hypothetical protein A3J38_00475 [Gammaproteobacteria bacterium RIFCSPHIGHO2_12_FULL_45_9]|nr:MAG: hypothetical protein A3J38_00475 [Gammaproteobacteria bacterium RIFCSPHIGHO2_12_FULL_45_9]